MKYIEKEKEFLWWRQKYLEVMLIALRTYKQTNQKIFYEKAQYFGREGEKCKQEAERLSRTNDQGKQDERRILQPYLSQNEMAEIDFANF